MNLDTDYLVRRGLPLANADQLRGELRRRLLEEARDKQYAGDWIGAPPIHADIDEDALDEATARWRRGERREALHYLEQALGRDFSGLGDLRPEDLR